MAGQPLPVVFSWYLRRRATRLRASLLLLAIVSCVFGTIWVSAWVCQQFALPLFFDLLQRNYRLSANTHRTYEHILSYIVAGSIVILTGLFSLRAYTLRRRRDTAEQATCIVDLLLHLAHLRRDRIALLSNTDSKNRSSRQNAGTRDGDSDVDGILVHACRTRYAELHVHHSTLYTLYGLMMSPKKPNAVSRSNSKDVSDAHWWLQHQHTMDEDTRCDLLSKAVQMIRPAFDIVKQKLRNRTRQMIQAGEYVMHRPRLTLRMNRFTRTKGEIQPGSSKSDGSDAELSTAALQIFESFYRPKNSRSGIVPHAAYPTIDAHQHPSPAGLGRCAFESQTIVRHGHFCHESHASSVWNTALFDGNSDTSQMDTDTKCKSNILINLNLMGWNEKSRIDDHNDHIQQFNQDADGTVCILSFNFPVRPVDELVFPKDDGDWIAMLDPSRRCVGLYYDMMESNRQSMMHLIKVIFNRRWTTGNNSSAQELQCISDLIQRKHNLEAAQKLNAIAQRCKICKTNHTSLCQPSTGATCTEVVETIAKLLMFRRAIDDDGSHMRAITPFDIASADSAEFSLLPAW
jgi:hypothetical protein